MADVNITADPIEISLSIKFLFSQYPSAPRNVDLDLIFDCGYEDVHGNKDAGIPVIEISLTGTWRDVLFGGEAIDISIAPVGTWGEGILVSDGATIDISIGFSSGLAAAQFTTESLRSNWVKWSNVGSIDFTIWKDNVAGERPMPWKGWVYAIKKLGGRAISYGENGVSILSPHGNAWGEQTIYRLGVKGKNAIAGDDKIQFFIDKKNQLFSVEESLEKLDYSEYLSVLTDPVLSYDIETGLLYICDGTYGFVYNHSGDPEERSFGSGPVNITGLSSQDGTLYVVSPETIVTPAFEICTDIFDLWSRKSKTIQSVEFGTDTDKTLYGSIDFRNDVSASFAQSSWKEVSGNGVLWQTVFGREFRFRLKTAEYDYLELDYLNVFGVIHAN